MLMFVLIGLSLVLMGVAGLQFTYLFYVDGLYRERKKYLQELEHNYAQLGEKLAAAERQIEKQNEMLKAVNSEKWDDEAWADLIEDRY